MLIKAAETVSCLDFDGGWLYIDTCGTVVSSLDTATEQDIYSAESRNMLGKYQLLPWLCYVCSIPGPALKVLKDMVTELLFLWLLKDQGFQS